MVINPLSYFLELELIENLKESPDLLIPNSIEKEPNLIVVFPGEMYYMFELAKHDDPLKGSFKFVLKSSQLDEEFDSQSAVFCECDAEQLFEEYDDAYNDLILSLKPYQPYSCPVLFSVYQWLHFDITNYNFQCGRWAQMLVSHFQLSFCDEGCILEPPEGCGDPPSAPCFVNNCSRVKLATSDAPSYIMSNDPLAQYLKENTKRHVWVELGNRDDCHGLTDYKWKSYDLWVGGCLPWLFPFLY